ncbi:hypothetical protein R3Q06_29355 [Rhodococcus erythropolis]|uniref:hypothetical protein n=1 Tax=Rhodococcus erythropolis TaxID=1833 RepID=UPI002949C04F|nr:hypothetical protein [Rhodococcus erythropolis]MDV6277603.1 hypothetical protein [Rhodococcus erythropolis]
MSTVEITSRTGLVNAWSAIRVGLGSLLDLRGQATYEAMQDLLPSPKLRPMSAIYADTKPGDVGNSDIAQIVAHVVAQINQHQHIHLPEQAPDPNQLAELREKVPEVYDLWIETTRKRNDHEIWQSRKIIRQPYLLASLGHG